MNLLMNISDHKIRDNGTRNDSTGYGGGNVDEWSGGGYFGNGYGGGWGIHGSGWPSPLGLVENIRGQSVPKFGNNGNGFGAAGGGLDNNDGVGA